MSLIEAAEWFASLDHSSVVFEADRCLHSFDRYSDCEACFNICPVKAIEPAKPPRFDPQSCQNCLACLVVCPLNAYQARDYMARLFRTFMSVEGNEIELLCAKNRHAEYGVSESSVGIVVPGCLAGLGSSVYLSFLAVDINNVTVRTDDCLDCEWGALYTEIRAQILGAKDLLNMWRSADIIHEVSMLRTSAKRPLWYAENPPVSRRGLFRMIAKQGQAALKHVLQDESNFSSHSVGRNRKRFLNAMAHLSYPESAVNSELSGLGFAVLDITEACTACGACGRACPTGALTFTKDDANMTFALEFSARYCISCEVCVHVCIPSAIVMRREPTFEQVFLEEKSILRSGRLVKCRRCGTLMAEHADRSLCALCDYRRTYPFGTIPLPIFKKMDLDAKGKES